MTRTVAIARGPLSLHTPIVVHPEIARPIVIAGRALERQVPGPYLVRALVHLFVSGPVLHCVIRPAPKAHTAPEGLATVPLNATTAGIAVPPMISDTIGWFPLRAIPTLVQTRMHTLVRGDANAPAHATLIFVMKRI